MDEKCIGIIGALSAEIGFLISELSNLEEKTIANIVFYKGIIGNKNVVIAKSGIGKINTAMCATAMILSFDMKEIIHIGIAGLLDDSLSLSDIAIADNVCQHDFDVTPFGLKRGVIEGLEIALFPCDKDIISKLEKCAKSLNINYKIGTIATGDQFINDANTKKEIIKNFNAIACEMEGAATGVVCYLNKIPFAVVRAFSDKGSDVKKSDYFAAKYFAADTATKLIIKYLRGN